MCAYLVCVSSVLYTVSVLILHRESFSSSPLHYAMCSLVKRHACVRAKRLRMRDEDLTAICNRTKKNDEAGISTRAFPLESSSNKLRYQVSASKNGVRNDLFDPTLAIPFLRD